MTRRISIEPFLRTTYDFPDDLARAYRSLTAVDAEDVWASEYWVEHDVHPELISFTTRVVRCPGVNTPMRENEAVDFALNRIRTGSEVRKNSVCGAVPIIRTVIMPDGSVRETEARGWLFYGLATYDVIDLTGQN